ncbi:carbamoyl phosphate synthase small subunit [Sediminibacillus dalangtanensis]|uniref:Carbamoyl phosphate synthase small chain n=1 Tax=Sediminibacillus dalangtanensis TaxID=2729421 RepID=A0ABX7VNN7_9BACI|nr:carbamoyl phosphate synthase small subunit [Sediminibacillus dalangtanensis]QTM98058.1 carbamoyl phosphate synthase small subunit [Sediminibacillus dalangtanensis]
MIETPGYLVLSTGDVLEGKWLGTEIAVEGELVFNTAMTGYQEVMTDPSYAGQIVTMTYPLIGNYGVNEIDHESIKPALAGLIISSACRTPEHYQAKYTVKEMVEQYKVPTLYDMDTRALTKIIREHGEVYGKITTQPEDLPEDRKVDPEIVKQVSVNNMIEILAKPMPAFSGQKTKHIVLYDYGYKHSITHTLTELGCNVTVVPYDTDPAVLHNLKPDGVVLSNGPGNPEDLAGLGNNIKQITETYPTLGICLGHQLVALAYGGKTERLPYGHRGSNHPVKDLLTGKVFITSQNHGYVVDENSISLTEWEVSHINVNDRSVEGLIHRHKPVLTVQFHPEAHPGPVDTYSIFREYLQMIPSKGEKQHA